jgi:DNA-binding transcriptional LysR family regulator
MALVDPALRYFLEVYETGSVNAAARRLYVASSAISRQVARLEHEVGAPLFERRPTGVVATEAGHVFAGYARRAVQDAVSVLDEVQERQQAATVISLAATDGSGHDLLPRVAAGYRAEHPDARFALTLAGPKVVAQLVRDGVADLAVTFTLAIDADVAIVYSRPAPLKAVVRADHPLAGRTSVSLRDLRGLPLVLSSPSTTNRSLFDISCAAAGFAVEPVFVCDNPDAMLRFVRESGAVTVLGQVTVGSHVEDGGLVALPLRGPEFAQRTLQVQARVGRRLPAPVERFAQHLVAVLEQTEV